jgi:SAM-dependent methyltransferase
MIKITPGLIRPLITKDNELFIPESITRAISSSVVSSPNIIQEEGERLKKLYKEHETKNEPMKIDYLGDITIDAYSVYYLPRNSLIPKVSILCCAYSEVLCNLPNKLRVLDLGSGTGGVVLGLLDLFNNTALTSTRLIITSLDVSQDALVRQNQLAKNINLKNSSLECYQGNLSRPETYRDKITANAPFDMVYAANLFSELRPHDIDSLLKEVIPLLSETGIFINVEPHGEYIKNQRPRIAKMALTLGLHIYYPCPVHIPCPKTQCWMWREDNFECPDILSGGEILQTTKVQKAHWTIFSRQPCSIHDYLRTKNPKLTWSVKAPKYRHRFEKTKIIQRIELCGHHDIDYERDFSSMIILSPEPYKRGSFIGYSDDFSEIEFWDII